MFRKVVLYCLVCVCVLLSACTGRIEAVNGVEFFGAFEKPFKHGELEQTVWEKNEYTLFVVYEPRNRSAQFVVLDGYDFNFENLTNQYWSRMFAPTETSGGYSRDGMMSRFLGDGWKLVGSWKDRVYARILIDKFSKWPRGIDPSVPGFRVGP